MLRDLLGACKDAGKRSSRHSKEGDVGEADSSKEKGLGSNKDTKYLKSEVLEDELDEKEVIERNVDHILGFLEQLKDREKSGLAVECKEKCQKLKDGMRRWMQEFDRTKEMPGNRVKKCDGKIYNGRGTVTQNSGSAKVKRSKSVSPQIKSRRISDTSDTETENSEVSYGDEDSSSESCKESASDESIEGRGKRNGNKGGVVLTELMKVMSTLDGRRSSNFEKFDEESGYDFEKYLRKFEAYCRDNIRGNKYVWITELEKQLQGRMLQAFEVLRDEDDDYRDIKKKLLRWYKDMKDSRKKNLRKKYEKMKYRSGESLFLYCGRLEKAFKVAYPRRNVERNKVLIEKFKQTIPKAFARMLKNHTMMCKVTGRRTTWSEMKKFAQIQDMEMEEQNNLDSSESETEIIIDVGREIKKDIENDRQCTNVVRYEGLSNPNPDKFQEFGRPRLYNNSGYNSDFRHMNDRNMREWAGTGARPRSNAAMNLNQSNLQQFPRALRSRTVTCYFCGRLGHIAAVCREKQRADRNKLCYVCGDGSHFQSQCPEVVGVEQQDKYYNRRSVDVSNDNPLPQRIYRPMRGGKVGGISRRKYGEAGRDMDYNEENDSGGNNGDRQIRFADYSYGEELNGENADVEDRPLN